MERVLNVLIPLIVWVILSALWVHVVWTWLVVG